MARGVFGHLALKLSAHPENVATEALAYVLNRSPAALGALNGLVARMVPAWVPVVAVETQGAGDDGAIPDLVGLDAAGVARLLGEAKFGAGFTDHQPVTYLRRLPAGSPGVLLVIAPSKRLDLLGRELDRRTSADGWAACLPTSGERRHVALDTDRTLALISWAALLADLTNAVRDAGDRQAEADLEQLAGLAEAMEDQVFTPLTSEELTGSTPVRMLQYLDIVDRATNRLVAEGLATRSAEGGGALYSSSGRNYTGQYLALSGVTCLLRVSWPHWANDYASPIWLQVGFKKGQPPAAAALSVLRPLAVSGRVFEHTGFADVAIDLPTGTDLDEVMAAVVEQLAEVGRLLAGLPRA